MTDMKEMSPQGRPAIIAAGMTDKGRLRDNNEDNFYIDEEFGFFIVSDGIGGRQAGEKASEVVVTVLPIQVNSIINTSDPADVLERSIQFLSNQLREYADEVRELRGAGATIVSCLIRDGKAFVAHLGDSRVYLMRRGVFELLTEDHSIVSMLIKIGNITKKQARTHPARHTITRYVGMKSRGIPDVRPVDLLPGDRLLLCTDGLTDMLGDREIGQILLEEPDPDRACKELIDRANEAGGKDNITAVIIRYGEEKKKGGKKRQKIRVKRFVFYEKKEQEKQTRSGRVIRPVNNNGRVNNGYS